jgi:hypothetical protein
MIREIATGHWIASSVEPIRAEDLRNLEEGWKFDWLTAIGRAEVFKLIEPASPTVIYGLIALARRQDHVEVTLLESSPENVGGGKKFERIPGCLLSYAVRFSAALDFDGCLSLIAKTDLIETFISYGFIRIGNSNRLNLLPPFTAILIATYQREPTNG